MMYSVAPTRRRSSSSGMSGRAHQGGFGKAVRIIDDPGRAVQIGLGGWCRGPVACFHRQALIGPDMMPSAHFGV